MPADNAPPPVNPPAADSGANDPGTGGGPGGSWATPVQIRSIASYQVLLAILALYALVKLLPHPTAAGTAARDAAPANRAVATADSLAPDDSAGQDSAAARATDSVTGTGAPTDIVGRPGNLVCDLSATSAMQSNEAMLDPECVSLLGLKFPLWKQQRLLLLVLLAGLIGATFRGLGSVALYVGTRMMRASWLLQYYVQPVRGAILGLLFYLLFRGGLFSASAAFDTTDSVGFMALAGLVGLFEKEATKKLQQIASALFAPHEQNVERAPVGAESTTGTTPVVAPPAVAPVLTSVEPKELFAGDQTPATLSVHGANLAGATFSVSRDGMAMSARQVEHVSDTLVQVTLQPADVATPGRLRLQGESANAGASQALEVDVLAANADLP
jgi:hypothetical protein